MVSQTRVLSGATSANLAGTSHTNIVTAQRTYNAHNLRCEINIESEAMEANANGWWEVYMFPGDIITTTDLPTSWSNFNDEKVSQYLWGMGLWMASNQTPFHTVFAPNTTRNVPKNGRIFLRVKVEGTLPVLTANRINTLIMYHVNE